MPTSTKKELGEHVAKKLGEDTTRKLQEKLNLPAAEAAMVGKPASPVESMVPPEVDKEALILEDLYNRIRKFNRAKERAIKVFNQQDKLMQDLLKYLKRNNLDGGYFNKKFSPLEMLEKIMDENDKPRFVVDLEQIGKTETLEVTKTLWGHKKASLWSFKLKEKK